MTNEETIEVLDDMKVKIDIPKSAITQRKRNEALDKAIKAIEQTSWIPVSERLPEPNRLVLCHITTGTTVTYFLALWNDIQNDWEEGIGGYRLLKNDLGYEVIEWMPIPQKFEAESENKK